MKVRQLVSMIEQMVGNESEPKAVIVNINTRPGKAA